MGRDNVLPKRVFGYLQRKFHTPVINIGLIGLVGIVAVALDPATSVSFINFGAFTAFTFVNLCVIGMAIRRRTLRGVKRMLLNLVLPLAGAAVDVWLLTNLDAHRHQARSDLARHRHRLPGVPDQGLPPPTAGDGVRRGTPGTPDAEA